MAMSENGVRLLDFLKANSGANVTAQEAAEALGVKLASVTGSFNALVKKEMGVRVEEEIQVEDGTHKKVKFLKLTDKGMAFDPAAEEVKETK